MALGFLALLVIAWMVKHWTLVVVASAVCLLGRAAVGVFRRGWAAREDRRRHARARREIEAWHGITLQRMRQAADRHVIEAECWEE